MTRERQGPEDDGSGRANAYPENPVLARVRRGAWVESQHRGAWVWVDGSGAVLAGAGSFDAPYFARSSVKALQALPLFETGAAERFGLTDVELALALASHNAEPCHTETVAAFLARQGLGVDALLCGPQEPGDPAARAALRAAGVPPSALHNNCSGKHAGFLALAQHLGVPVERYLDPESEGQQLVRTAVAEMAGIDASRLTVAVDGCSAPTLRLPLVGLATAFARVANPGGLTPERRAHCERMTRVVAENPQLIAGDFRRLCTDIARATGGRLFPKIGAEAIYAIGVRGADRGLAVKLDDGGQRGLGPVVLALLERFELLLPAELAALEPWRARTLRNRAGLAVGTVEVVA